MVWPIAFYLASHLPFLTRLPIFNDEAIYLQWGWKEISIPGQAYYSLFDGKQPLLMWVFGIVSSLFPDPLLASRMVSVGIGLLTMIGIYVLSKKLFSDRVATIAALLYCCIPAFVFFDRQALMESAIACIGVWSVFLIVLFRERRDRKYALILGAVLAVGFWIKSTTLIFFLLALFLVASPWMLPGLVLIIPLTIQPEFLGIFSLNNRYVLTFQELATLPVSMWMTHLFATLSIFFWYLTPVVCGCVLIGIWKIFRTQRVLLFWSMGGLVLFVLTVRNPSLRYLVPFLPTFCVIASVGYWQILGKIKISGALFGTVIFLIPSFISSLLIFSPLRYFYFMEQFTPHAQRDEYVSSWPSGYGVSEVVSTIMNKQGSRKTMIWTKGDWGNPESSIAVYFEKSKTIHVQHFYPSLLEPHLLPRDCRYPEKDVYFVTRDEEPLVDRNYFDLVKKFYKPGEIHFIGLYEMKKTCLQQK